MATSPPLIPTASRAVEPISPANYAYIQELVYRSSGIVLDETKTYLLESRLTPIARSHGMESLDSLCEALRASAPPLRTEVVEAMTTNETLFFRDPQLFDVLQKEILPGLIERRSALRKLSFWSAAASTGQEAYSLAILLLELGLHGWQVQVTGTDLNHQVLEKARSGLYQQLEVNRGLPAKYLVKYFERRGTTWQVKDELRRMVEFTPFDLRQSMRNRGPYDLILCRNVLIYFDVETKKKILTEMRHALVPKGLLILGSAETTLNLDNSFVRKSAAGAGYYEAP